MAWEEESRRHGRRGGSGGGGRGRRKRHCGSIDERESREGKLGGEHARADRTMRSLPVCLPLDNALLGCAEGSVSGKGERTRRNERTSLNLEINVSRYASP